MRPALAAALLAALAACHTGDMPAGSERQPATTLPAAANRLELPAFLEPYYAPAFDVGTSPLQLVQRRTENGVERYTYQTQDGTLSLTVENAACKSPQCQAVFDNVKGHWNGVLSEKGGAFVAIDRTEAHAQTADGDVSHRMFVYVLPSSVQIWAYSVLGEADDPRIAKYEVIRRIVDRQRYQDALAQGNVSMGHWRVRIHEHMKYLIDSGAEDEGLSVLGNLLATSPYDHEAHMMFVTHAPDSSAARNSASIVFKNAESRSLTDDAARFLGHEIPVLNDLPELDAGEAGLRVVLVPLPPCNPWLLEEAARVFEQITDIPVSVRRLPGAWEWDEPDRIANQRTAQGMLIKLKGENVDFSGWNPDRYVDALREEAAGSDPLTRYFVNTFADGLIDEPGQYLADSYLERFSRIIDPYRAGDRRTMYVAITANNIYAGDNNYVFSIGRPGRQRASLMSYHMMLGETLRAEFPSRRRLIERIAKELVPASLKQLGIPRSTDPTCPYSYSSGVDRLDQKSLTLSDPVRAALAPLRQEQER